MSSFNEKALIWMNGRLIPWKEAKIHVASHVVHYGSSVFEGIRAYHTTKGTAIFRLDDHLQRMYDSCKIYRIDVPYSLAEMKEAVIETIKANQLEACYIRPVIFRGYGSLGVNPFPNPVECAILVWEWGQYLGKDSVEQGVDVKIATWQRMAPNSFPALAKTGANYMNSQLIKMEAVLEGYAEGIALNIRGHVSEGSGENLFLVYQGKIYTPPLSSSVLPGITRDTVIVLAQEIGLEVKEDTIPREMLYIADELFFTGTAAEITPIRSVDKISIGEGKRGPVTAQLQKNFYAYINGEEEDRYHWLTYVSRKK